MSRKKGKRPLSNPMACSTLTRDAVKRSLNADLFSSRKSPRGALKGGIIIKEGLYAPSPRRYSLEPKTFRENGWGYNFAKHGSREQNLATQGKCMGFVIANNKHVQRITAFPVEIILPVEPWAERQWEESTIRKSDTIGELRFFQNQLADNLSLFLRRAKNTLDSEVTTKPKGHDRGIAGRYLIRFQSAHRGFCYLPGYLGSQGTSEAPKSGVLAGPAY